VAGKPKPEAGPARPPADWEDHLGAAPFTRATAQANAIAQASAAALDTEHRQRHTTAFIDRYDSYWSRDPGRANGPFV
jgi:hypothetical protein